MEEPGRLNQARPCITDCTPTSVLLVEHHLAFLSLASTLCSMQILALTCRKPSLSNSSSGATLISSTSRSSCDLHSNLADNSHPVIQWCWNLWVPPILLPIAHTKSPSETSK
eukprot:6455031-Amphidinium_carterae.2